MENSPSIGSFSTFDATKLSGPELDCLKEAFALFDADHDGEITIGELGRVMKNHGLNPTEDELKDMIRNVDKNSNGAIDFNEFIEMMLRRDSKIEEDVVHAFRVFDRDGDGLISKEELKLTMNNLGEPLTDAEVKAMIEEADMDGDGRINFQEFSRLMQSQQGGGGGPSKSNGRDLGFM
ncbi:neo-calmodulin [Lepeophtheirus salmonis]|uniref:Calmodulinlike [Monodelphis domestica] n=1 Tax=Lepeophtheirus salmonis TaxID=72036 RepID=A0A0K2U6T2_LEPSM|nr:neo-calmodulin-like [Lepeophtheirus salmonis]XP_040570187.1 neo-calmodulin-like [Lepeophtheirus salmonis]XP_040570188.1 neo-calmodulin-like [Lepeophtheirus salmonis]